MFSAVMTDDQVSEVTQALYLEQLTSSSLKKPVELINSFLTLQVAPKKRLCLNVHISFDISPSIS
jgi:hypothetical protein